MRSLASAARLLARIIDPATSQPLLDELGFGRLVPLEREDRASLALPETVGNPHIARGIGTLRVLVFEAGPSQHFRKELNRVAGGLASSGPGLLWTLIAIDREAGQTAVAAFDLSSNRPRVAALIATSQNIVDSDSETVCALAAARNSSDALTHCRWLEILGRESVNRKFFRALEHQVSQLAASLLPSARKEDAFELALLHSSRLLFLSFLETKGWLDGDRGFLANQYADCMVSGGRFHARVLEPLFFGTLNTRRRDRARRAAAFGRIPFLNGGLFSRSPLEGRLAKTFFSDESLGDLFGELLSRYRFTAREDTTLWSEAAIDPEMLGKSFECLMSSDTRKNTGAFYTPQSLVARVAETTLAYALESSTIPYDDVSCALQGEMPPPRQRRNILERLRTMTVLDPACGSGAFLIHVLEQLSTLCVRLGDPRPLHVIRREILTQTIFGVDVNPTAVWLCELRLWLSMAIEDPEKDPFRVTPLPNLDRNIRVGDSLSGEGFKGTASVLPSRRIAAARGRYCRATGPRKRSLARHLDSIERECAIAVAALRVRRLREKRRDTLDQLRSRDLFGQRHYPAAKSSGQLARVRDEMRRAESELRHLKNGGAMPFSFAAQFADVAGRGGFTVVVGNPPWIRTH
ncbi:MAG TPA: N-6 DNA methylase, partial [Gemmatimonadaceae bacterium]|nr:N-6 DNA methylase [Gemmatimonadaceae bacterium]